MRLYWPVLLFSFIVSVIEHGFNINLKTEID